MSSLVFPVGILFPTRVGMILDILAGQRHTMPFPHTRGDDPFVHAFMSSMAFFSPHAWG